MVARLAAIAAWLVFLAACALAIANARFVADLSSFLPEAPAPEQRLLVEQLRSGTVARLMLLGIEGGDAKGRAALSRALAASLRADPQFSSVSNGTARALGREREILFAHRYALSPRVTADRFSPQGLREAIGETLDLLASPAGLFAKRLASRDPTGETLALAAELEREDGPALAEGVWASGERAFLVALTRAGAADVDAQARATQRAQEAFREVAARAGPSAEGTRLVMTGAGVLSARARALIERDVVRLTTASAVLVIALLLAVYRSGIVLALGLVPVVTGAAAGIAAVALGFGVVHGITLGFGATLIGEAVDYAIYLFVQGGRALWPTIRLGVLTSIAGFCALLFSGLPGLVQLGLYSIAGVAVAALVTRYVLPQLLPAGFAIRDVSRLGAALESAAAHASRARWAVVALAVAAVLALAAKQASLWDAELASLNPISAEDRALDGQLRAGLGAADVRYMVTVSAESVDEALVGAERVGARLDGLVAAGRLGGYDSPARLLPSAGTQRARLAALPEEQMLRANLRKALEELPLRPEKLEGFVADVAAARAARPLAREDLAGTAFEAALDGMLSKDAASRWTAIVTLRPAQRTGSIDAAALREAIAGIPSTTFVDLKAEVDRLYGTYFGRALAASAAGFAVILALLFAALRDAKRVLGVVAPLVAAVAVVAALHALAGTKLTLMHLVGFLLAFAVGSNYALFFDRLPPAGDAAAQRTLASLALANATTVASFGVLALSQIPVLRAIGSTVALGALLALVFTAALSSRYNRRGEKT